MELLAEFGVITGSVALLGWFLRSYLDRRLTAQFAKVEKLHDIAVQLTRTRLEEAYEALNELQRTATQCRNALRTLCSEISEASASAVLEAYAELEATLYSRQLIVPLTAWKPMHIHKRLYDTLVTRIRVETPEKFSARQESSPLCTETLRAVETSHASIQETLRKELLKLEDVGTSRN